MKREFLKDLNLENEVIDKIMAEYGKSIQAKDNKIGELETTIGLKEQEITKANDAIKSFEGVNLEELNNKISNYETEKKNLEKDYKKQLSAIKRDTALKEKLSSFKFSSEYGRKAVFNELKERDLKFEDDKLIGFDDVFNGIIQADPSVVIKEEPQPQNNFKVDFAASHANTGVQAPIDNDAVMNKLLFG